MSGTFINDGVPEPEVMEVDGYDEQIARIRRSNDPHLRIVGDWGDCEGIFAFTNRGRFANAPRLCLTQIKNDILRGLSVPLFPTEFISRIVDDPRIPRDPEDIDPRYLEAFRDYQREIDAANEGYCEVLDVG